MPEIQMPKLSDTMTEGTLVAWKKKKGDKVSAGEVLAEIETDKATMEWESPEDGTLDGDLCRGRRQGERRRQNRVHRNQRRSGRKRRSETGKKQKPPPEAHRKRPDGSTSKTRTEATPTEADGLLHEKQIRVSGVRVKASPLARRVAAELGIDISSVKGTGPEGRVTETDVRAAGKPRAPVQAAASPIRDG